MPPEKHSASVQDFAATFLVMLSYLLSIYRFVTAEYWIDIAAGVGIAIVIPGTEYLLARLHKALGS